MKEIPGTARGIREGRPFGWKLPRQMRRAPDHSGAARTTGTGPPVTAAKERRRKP